MSCHALVARLGWYCMTTYVLGRSISPASRVNSADFLLWDKPLLLAFEHSHSELKPCASAYPIENITLLRLL